MPRRLVKLALSGAIGLTTLILFCGAMVAHQATDEQHGVVDAVMAAPVAIVPGARVYPDGSPSPVLQHRLRGALDLYREGVVDHILVSGDNRVSHYNEPVAMRNALVAMGVPEADITLDYAGLDTWDTCLRANQQFGVAEAVLVTQGLYADRISALCAQAGVANSVLTVEAPARPWNHALMAYGREQLARVKAVGDLVRQPPARHGGAFIGLPGSVGMPEHGHPPDWDWTVDDADEAE